MHPVPRSPCPVSTDEQVPYLPSRRQQLLTLGRNMANHCVEQRKDFIVKRVICRTDYLFDNEVLKFSLSVSLMKNSFGSVHFRYIASSMHHKLGYSINSLKIKY